MHKKSRAQHHFSRMNCSRQCFGKPSSRLPWDLVTRKSWSRGSCHFLSSVFSVNACFVFVFVVFYLWVNSDNIIHWQTRHTGLFQIPCLGLCHLSTNWKILLISLSLIRRPVFFRSIWIIFIFRKSMQILFTDRVPLIIRHMDQILGEGRSITITL